MSRASDFSAYLQECQRRAFSWHNFNCKDFCRGWVERAEHRQLSVPESLREGACMLHLFGAADSVSRCLGKDPIEIKQAMVGDVVLFPGKRNRFFLGLCNGRTSALMPFSAEIGELVFVDTLGATHAWHVDWSAP